MANSTSPKSVHETQILKYVLYQTEGVIMLFFNCLIFSTIIRHRSLRIRKQYIIIGALALADSLQGSALLAAGIHRMTKILLGQDTELWTMWQCLLTYHCFMWLFSDPLAGLMLAVVSIDRLVAVTWPVKYYKRGIKYGLGLVSLPYIYMVASGSFGIYLSYTLSDEAKYRSVCFTSDSLPNGFYNYHKWMQILGAFASVVIYIFVIIMYKKGNNQVVPQVNNTKERADRKIEQSFEKKLTKSLGMLTITTFFLYVIPTVLDPLSVNWKHKLTDDQFAKIQVYSNAFSQLNPILNLVIYVSRLEPIRTGIKYVLLCKGQLPHNLNLVATKTAPTRNQQSKRNNARNPAARETMF